MSSGKDLSEVKDDKSSEFYPMDDDIFADYGLSTKDLGGAFMGGGKAGGKKPSFFKSLAKSTLGFGKKLASFYFPEVIDFGNSFRDIKDEVGMRMMEGMETKDGKALTRVIDRLKNVGLKELTKDVAKGTADYVKGKAKEFASGNIFFTKETNMMDLFGAGMDSSYDHDSSDSTEPIDPFLAAYDQAKKGLSGPSAETNKGTKATLFMGKQQIYAIENQTNTLSNLMVESIRFDKKREIITGRTTKLYYNRTIRIQENMARNLGTLVAFNNSIVKSSIMANLEFQQKMLAVGTDTFAMLKAFKDEMILIGTIPDRVKFDTRDDKYEDMFASSSLGVSGWTKKLTGNLKGVFDSTAVGQVYNMGKMFGEMGTGGVDPLQMGLLSVPSMLMGGQARMKLDSLNNLFSGIWGGINNKLVDMRQSDKRIKQMIGQIGGIKDFGSMISGNFGAEKDVKAKFDQVFYDAVTKVIPTYLGRIESGISGKDEMIWDYEAGSMIYARQTKDIYETKKKMALNADVYTTMTKGMITEIANKKIEDQSIDINEDVMIEDFETIFENLAVGQKVFDETKLDVTKQSRDDAYIAEISRGLKDPKSLQLYLDAYKMMSPSMQNQFTASLTKAKVSYNQFRDMTMKNRGMFSSPQIRDKMIQEDLERLSLSSSNLNVADFADDKNSAMYRLALQEEIQRARFKLFTTSGVEEIEETSASGLVADKNMTKKKSSVDWLGEIYNLLLDGIMVYPLQMSKSVKEMFGKKFKRRIDIVNAEETNEEQRAAMMSSINKMLIGGGADLAMSGRSVRANMKGVAGISEKFEKGIDSLSALANIGFARMTRSPKEDEQYSSIDPAAIEISVKTGKISREEADKIYEEAASIEPSKFAMFLKNNKILKRIDGFIKDEDRNEASPEEESKQSLTDRMISRGIKGESLAAIKENTLSYTSEFGNSKNYKFDKKDLKDGSAVVNNKGIASKIIIKDDQSEGHLKKLVSALDWRSHEKKSIPVHILENLADDKSKTESVTRGLEPAMNQTVEVVNKIEEHLHKLVSALNWRNFSRQSIPVRVVEGIYMDPDGGSPSKDSGTPLTSMTAETFIGILSAGKTKAADAVKNNKQLKEIYENLPPEMKKVLDKEDDYSIKDLKDEMLSKAKDKLEGNKFYQSSRNFIKEKYNVIYKHLPKDVKAAFDKGDDTTVRDLLNKKYSALYSKLPSDIQMFFHKDNDFGLKELKDSTVEKIKNSKGFEFVDDVQKDIKNVFDKDSDFTAKDLRQKLGSKAYNKLPKEVRKVLDKSDDYKLKDLGSDLSSKLKESKSFQRAKGLFDSNYEKLKGTKAYQGAADFLKDNFDKVNKSKAFKTTKDFFKTQYGKAYSKFPKDLKQALDKNDTMTIRELLKNKYSDLHDQLPDSLKKTLDKNNEFSFIDLKNQIFSDAKDKIGKNKHYKAVRSFFHRGRSDEELEDDADENEYVRVKRKRKGASGAIGGAFDIGKVGVKAGYKVGKFGVKTGLKTAKVLAKPAYKLGKFGVKAGVKTGITGALLAGSAVKGAAGLTGGALKGLGHILPGGLGDVVGGTGAMISGAGKHVPGLKTRKKIKMFARKLRSGNLTDSERERLSAEETDAILKQSQMDEMSDNLREKKKGRFGKKFSSMKSSLLSGASKLGLGGIASKFGLGKGSTGAEDEEDDDDDDDDGKPGKIKKFLGKVGGGLAAGFAALSGLGKRAVAPVAAALAVKDTRDKLEERGHSRGSILKNIFTSATAGQDYDEVTGESIKGNKLEATARNLNVRNMIDMGLTTAGKNKLGALKNVKKGKILGKITQRIDKFFGKVLKPFKKFLIRKFGSTKGLKMVDNITKFAKGGISKAIKRLGMKIAPKLTTKLISMGASMSNPAVAAAILAADFGMGAANVRNIFGLPKGVKASFGMTALAGLVNIVTQRLMFGLIPSKTAMTFLLKLFDMVGIEGAKKIIEGQKRLKVFTNARARIMGVDPDRLQNWESRRLLSGIFNPDKKFAALLGFGSGPESIKNYVKWKNQIYTPLNNVMKETLTDFKGIEGYEKIKLDKLDPGQGEMGYQAQDAYRSEVINRMGDYAKANGIAEILKDIRSSEQTSGTVETNPDTGELEYDSEEPEDNLEEDIEEAASNDLLPVKASEKFTKYDSQPTAAKVEPLNIEETPDVFKSKPPVTTQPPATKPPGSYSKYDAPPAAKRRTVTVTRTSGPGEANRQRNRLMEETTGIVTGSTADNALKELKNLELNSDLKAESENSRKVAKEIGGTTNTLLAKLVEQNEKIIQISSQKPKDNTMLEMHNQLAAV